MTKINRKLLWCSFALYIALLVWVIFFKCGNPYSIIGSDGSLNPIEFGSYMGEYMSLNIKERFLYDFTIRPDDASAWFKDISLNMLLFSFMGIFIPLLLNDKNIWFSILFGFFISIIFEIYQLLTCFGSFGFIDILANTIGVVIGVLIYLLLIKLIPQEKIGKTVNIINIVILATCIPVLIFAFIYTGINFQYVIFRYSHAHIW